MSSVFIFSLFTQDSTPSAGSEWELADSSGLAASDDPAANESLAASYSLVANDSLDASDSLASSDSPAVGRFSSSNASETPSACLSQVSGCMAGYGCSSRQQSQQLLSLTIIRKVATFEDLQRY